MSYLKFSRVRHDPDDGLLVGWPVWAVPVNYWGPIASHLDILERALLGLVRTGCTHEDDITRLLGVADLTPEMVGRALNSLRAHDYIDASNALTDSGKHALESDQARAKVYQLGWVFYDGLRNGVFPFVQPGALRFFTRPELGRYQMVDVSAREDLRPQEYGQVCRGCALAVEAFNERLPLLELAEDDMDDEASEAERRLDMPIFTGLDATAIGEVEPLPLEFIELHRLVVEVTGVLVPGEMRVRLDSFSPFSSWDQRQYVEHLETINDQKLRDELEDLRVRIRKKGPDIIFGEQVGPDESVLAELEHNLRGLLGNRTRVPERILGELEPAEIKFIAYTHLGEDVPLLTRKDLAGNWGVTLETLLQTISIDCDSWNIPPEWKQTCVPFKGQANSVTWAWYCEQVRSKARPERWLDLPDMLRSNLSTMIKNMIPGRRRFGDIHCSSSLDYLAKAMLAVLSVSTTDSAPAAASAIGRLASWMDRGDVPLREIAEANHLRNAAQHADDLRHPDNTLKSMTPDAFKQAINKMRNVVFLLLNKIYQE